MNGFEVVFEIGFAVLWLALTGRQIWVSAWRPHVVASEEWSTAAVACHLTPGDRSTWLAGSEGPFHDLRVRFETWHASDKQLRTRIVVDAVDRGLVSLGLARETAATARAKRRGAREIETGDDGFDDEFYVTGPRTAVHAILDRETRALLRSLLVEVDVEISSGEVRGLVVQSADASRLHGLLLSRTLPLLLDAARRLRHPEDPARCLAGNATADREPGVRRENLLALVRDYPDTPLTRETVRAACADPSDDVRLRAAAILGDEGRPILLAVARDENGDDLTARRAIAALGGHLATAEVKEILGRALRSRRFETALECVASLGGRADEAGVAMISKVLAVEKGELAVAAARALGETGLAVAEPPLLAALGRELPDLRVAACVALGRVGSAGAVLPLKEIENRYRDDATRRAARQAVAAIQSRVPGASPGQLSLAAADSGGLSLAEDETGRLSLEEDRKRSGGGTQ